MSNSGSGQVESLWGRIKMSDMGSRVTQERPKIGEVPSIVGRKPNKSLLEAASELTGTHYRPRTKETSQAWEFLLAFVASRIGGEERDVLGAASEECLNILKDEEIKDLDKKSKLEKVLGLVLDTDALAQLINLSKRITDYSSPSAPQTGNEYEPDAVEEEDDVAVVFEEEEEIEEMTEEDEAELESSIPIIKAAQGSIDYKDEEEKVSSSLLLTTDRTEIKEEELEQLDLESISFPQGGHTMTNKRCIVPEKSTKVSKPGYEEIHIPAPEPKPLQEGETLIPISSLPKWAHAAFEGVTDKLNRIQSKLCRMAMESDENFLLCAPTGAGKTNVALLAMLREIGKHVEDPSSMGEFKMVYIAPMKALVQEMVSSFGRRLEPYGLKVRELTGDQQMTKAQISETHLIVTTPEKWDIITRKNNDLSYTRLVRLVIIDEIHLLHDDRGPVLEAIVARSLRQSEASQQWTRLVGLSATLPNYVDVGRFLRVDPKKGIFYFDSTFRPCPLAQQFVGITEKRPLQRMQLMNQIAYEKVIERAGVSQVLIFVHSRKDTAKSAKSIRDEAIARGTVGQLLRASGESKEHLAAAAKDCSNADLQDLLPYGFAIHHAGMARFDRTKVEELFAAGHIQILISTATLAWGVNLPAHTVIIKGTQVYSPEKGRWCELSSQDVLQMLGRAGRPQYDTHGEGIIITSHGEVQFYLSLLNQQLPIESQMASKIVDHLNAEIVLGTIRNRSEAVEWLGYTYLFVRMLRDPHLYGIPSPNYDGDKALGKFRASLVHSAALTLEKANLIRYDHRSGLMLGTEAGRVAAHFYIGHDSMAIYNQHLKPTASDMDICRIFSLSSEFKLIPVRQEERLELAKLAERVPLPIRENFDEPSAKINILLQSFISRLPLDGFSLAADMIYVTQSAGRILRALFELCLRRGWARPARRALDLCKMVEHRLWRSMTPLRQIDGVPTDVLRRLERKDFPFDHLFNLDVHELGELVRTPNAGRALQSALGKFPKFKVEVSTVPLTRELLRIDATIMPESGYGASNELYWVTVEDVDGENLLYVGNATLKAGIDQVATVIYVPLKGDETPPPILYLTVISDRWLGSEVRLPLILTKMTLPEKKQPPVEFVTEPYDPVSAFPQHVHLQQKYPSLDPVSFTALSAIFRSDHNVFIGSKEASTCGQIVVAELAIWRRLIRDGPSGLKCIYVVPDRESIVLVKDRFVQLFEEIKVGSLIGDAATDLKTLEASQVIVSAPLAWDQLSRRWKNRRAVQSVNLFIMDGLHHLYSDPIIEVVCSRMRFMAAQLEKEIRMILLSTPLWNSREVCSWLGVPPECVFNLNDFNIAKLVVQSFNQGHYPSLLLAMTRPAWLAAHDVAREGRCIVWVNDASQARQTALDFVALSQATKSMEEDGSRAFSGIEDEDLKECLAEGIVFVDPVCFDPQLVSMANIIVVSKEERLNPSIIGLKKVELNIILGTQEYNGVGRNYIDYPINDLYGLINCPSAARSLIFCHVSRRTALLSLLGSPMPLESSLDTCLTDQLNAEIAAHTVETKQDAVDYLTWTYLYRRLARNPNYYGLLSVGARAMSEYLSEMIETALNQLIEAKCIEISSEGQEETGVEAISSVNLGLIAAYYGVQCSTVEMLATSLSATVKIRGILDIISAAAEFDEMPLRKGEANILERLNGAVPFKADQANYHDPHVKVNLLLQAHFSRISLSPGLKGDLDNILIRTLPLVQATVDVLSSYGWLAPALAAMEFSQMLVQAIWNTDPPIRQLIDDGPTLKALVNSGITSVYDIDEQILNRLAPAEQGLVVQRLESYPSLEVQFGLDEEDLGVGSDAILRATITRPSDSPSTVNAPHFPAIKEEAWWLLLGVPSTRTLLGIKRFLPSGPTSNINLSFTVPEVPGQCSAKLYLVCDGWAGADQEFDVNLQISN